MRRAVTRAVLALVLTMGAALAAGGPAEAVLAGQFCANASAGVIMTADNGATVECLFNPNSNRNQWVAITTVAPVATTAPPVTVAPPTPAVIAGNGGTRILTIGPAPAPTAPLVVVPATPIVAPLSLTG